MHFGEFFSRQKNLFFFGEKRNLFIAQRPTITLETDPSLLKTTLSQVEKPENTPQKNLKNLANSINEQTESYFGFRSVESRVNNILEQKGIHMNTKTRALFMAALDIKYGGQKGKGIGIFTTKNEVKHQFFQRGRTRPTENGKKENFFHWQADQDLNTALEKELALFIQALNNNHNNENAVLDKYCERPLTSFEKEALTQKEKFASAKISNNMLEQVSAGLGSGLENGEKVNMAYIQQAYIDMRKKDEKNNINEFFSKYEPVSAIPNNKDILFLQKLSVNITVGSDAEKEDEESAGFTRGVLQDIISGLEKNDPVSRRKFQLIFSQLTLWETGYTANKEKIVAEENKESFTNNISRGVEGLMDMVQYGDETEKAAAFAIMLTLGLSLFGKGPFKGLQTPLLAVGGAAALGIAAESIYDVDLLGALKDSVTGDDSTPYSYFLRKHFSLESFFDGRHKEILLQMRQVDMRDIIAWQNDPDTKGEHPEKALKKYSRIQNAIQRASGVSNMSLLEKTQVAQQLVNATFEEIAMQMTASNIGVRPNTPSNTFSAKQRRINKGREYAEQNLQDKTFGDVLDSFIGKDIIEAKNPVAWLRNFLGGSLETMKEFFKEAGLNNEDEIYAFIYRVWKSPDKIQRTLAFGRELWNKGIDFTFDVAQGIYKWKPIDGKDYSLQWAWNDYAKEPVLTILGAAKGAGGIAIDVAKWFPGIPIKMLVDFLANYDGEIDTGAQNMVDAFLLWRLGAENAPDIIAEESTLKNGAPNKWFAEDKFGRYADEVVATLYPLTKLEKEWRRVNQEVQQLTLQRDNFILQFNTTNSKIEKTQLLKKIQNISSSLVQKVDESLQIKQEIEAKKSNTENLPEGIYKDENALFATALVPITITEEKAQETLAKEWTEKAMGEATKKIQEYATKNNISIPSLLKKESRDKKPENLTFNDFKNLDDYFIHNAILKEDNRKNYWMIALRVPTGIPIERTAQKEQSAEDMKGFERLFDEELEKFEKEKVQLFIRENKVYIFPSPLFPIPLPIGTQKNMTTNEMHGEKLPENVQETLQPLFGNKENGEPETRVTITRKQILDRMKEKDDAKWYWPDISSAERVENFIEYMKRRKKNTPESIKNGYLKENNLLHQDFVDAFNSLLFDKS